MSAAAQPNTARLPQRARSTRHIPVVLSWQLVVVTALLLVATRTWWGVGSASAILLVIVGLGAWTWRVYRRL